MHYSDYELSNTYIPVINYGLNLCSYICIRNTNVLRLIKEGLKVKCQPSFQPISIQLNIRTYVMLKNILNLLSVTVCPLVIHKL